MATGRTDVPRWPRAADGRQERNEMTSPEVLRAVSEAASPSDSRLGCAVALGLARKLGVTPGDIGDAANQQKVRIVNCQLGFFAVEKSVHDDLEAVPIEGPLADAIEGALSEGRLSCAAAFEVAGETRTPVKLVGDTATKKGIKIVSCQLGCFP
jgi:hypothetical protein